MSIIIEIIKGVIIGIANVIPGLSGGTIAVSMGIYEKLIHCINNIFKKPLKCLKEIWTYIVGIGLGIVLAVFGITYLFEVSPVPTAMLFVGLILGAIPTIGGKVDEKHIGKRDIITFVVFLAIIVSIPFLKSSVISIDENSIATYIIVFLLGIVAAATMVIPGVSGSMILMAFGYYEFIMATISNFIKAFVSFEFAEVLSLALILVPFGIGVLIGIIAIAKLIEWLLKHHKKTVYWGILGLLVASPFPIIINLDMTGLNIVVVIISVAACVVGAYSTMMLTRVGKKD